MGISPFRRSSFSSYDGCLQPNPNPVNFTVRKSIELENGNLIVVVNYPDCKNYEGNKIILYRQISLQDLLRQRKIDPHFSENKSFFSPFARFEPTTQGLEAATKLAELID